MKHRHLQRVIVLGSIVLACLLTVQVYWFSKAFDVAEKQFDHSVQVALKTVADSVSDVPSGTEVKKLSSNFFLVTAHSNLDSKRVDSLISQEFLLRNLDVEYELGIYSAYDDTLVYGNYVYATKRRLIEEEFSSSKFSEAEKNFAVFFPKKKSYLAGELNIWIFSTVVLILMVGFFAYAIFSLLREKRFSDLKNDFINNMTHELKTPVTNIRIVSEVLRAKSNDQDAYLDILEKESAHLQQKIDHVLRAAKGEYLNARPFELVDIHEIIEQSADVFRWKVQQRNGKLELHLGARNSLMAGDGELLKQALANILDNAEKYSPEAPEIIIRTLQGKNGIEIQIADKGAGIPHDLQSRVFDKFFRVNTSDIHNTKGFGLGLNFVKKVVNAHKGSVALTSRLSIGTEVTLSFPTV